MELIWLGLEAAGLGAVRLRKGDGDGIRIGDGDGMGVGAWSVAHPVPSVQAWSVGKEERH